MLTAQQKRAIGEAFVHTTGLVPELAVDELDEQGLQLCIWHLPNGLRFGLTVQKTGFRKQRLSLGLQRGLEPVETMLDESLPDDRVAALIGDPVHLVGVWLGRRSPKRFTLE